MAYTVPYTEVNGDVIVLNVLAMKDGGGLQAMAEGTYWKTSVGK